MTHTTHDAVGAGAVGGERFGIRLTDCLSQVEQSNVPAPATAVSTADATGLGEGLSRFASQSQCPPWTIGSRAGTSKIWGSVANEELIAIPFLALVRAPPQSQLGSAATAREPNELSFPSLLRSLISGGSARRRSRLTVVIKRIRTREGGKEVGRKTGMKERGEARPRLEVKKQVKRRSRRRRRRRRQRRGGATSKRERGRRERWKEQCERRCECN